MRQTHTMGCILHTEVPSFNRALETFALTDRNRIDKLTDLEVPWSEAVTNRQ